MATMSFTAKAEELSEHVRVNIWPIRTTLGVNNSSGANYVFNCKHSVYRSSIKFVRSLIGSNCKLMKFQK